MKSGPGREPFSESEERWRQDFWRTLSKLRGGGSFQTSFLDPLRLELARAALKEFPGLSYTLYGGHPDAERVCLNIYPAGRPAVLPRVACLLVAWSGRGAPPGRRDLLGALLALGLRRDQVGDILFLPEGKAAVMVLPAAAEQACSQLARVGETPVVCRVVDPADLPLPGESAQTVSGTVASLRLDAVISLGFGLSRSRAALLIKGGAARVNWRPVDSPAQTLRQGDLVFLQGRGRLEVTAVQGETRKGRLRLELKKIN